jgi:RNA polymerase sigma-70 factor (ECF subfamily)
MDAQERQAALERARQGDAQALGQLLESFRAYLRALSQALRAGRPSAWIDDSDLIQDALLEAHRSFPSFRGTTVAEFVVWVRRITLRTAARSLRRSSPGGKPDAGEARAENLLDLIADSGSSPSALAIRQEQATRITEALARLPDVMQQVLLARHVDGLPHAVIAERLGRTEAAVRVLYVRALYRLRELYRD